MQLALGLGANQDYALKDPAIPTGKIGRSGGCLGAVSL
jgi:hypothetical protein